MDSLQKQMEEHTVTVHESMSSLTSAEEELARLGVQDSDSAGPPSPLDEVAENHSVEEKPQTS